MNTPNASDENGKTAGLPGSAALAAAWPFGLFAALWAGLLGGFLGGDEYFATGDGFWQLTLIMAGCAFVAGTLAHMALGGSRSLLRTTLAGALTPFIAVVLGSGIIAWGALPYMALTGLAFVALPLSLPCALLGLLYGAVRVRLQSSWRRHDDR